MLRKYILDPSHVLREQPVQLKENLTYEEIPVQIVDRKEQVLRSKMIPLVKVLWKNHEREAATWEPEAQMRHQYPHLFFGCGMFLPVCLDFSFHFEDEMFLRREDFVTPCPERVYST